MAMIKQSEINPSLQFFSLFAKKASHNNINDVFCEVTTSEKINFISFHVYFSFIHHYFIEQMAIMIKQSEINPSLQFFSLFAKKASHNNINDVFCEFTTSESNSFYSLFICF